MMTAPLIRLEGVTRTFAGPPPLRALRGVSLAVPAGGYAAVVGPSGSGKSTLLHILGLLDRPSSGRYLLGGTDVGVLREAYRTGLRGTTIGFVFQDFHLLRQRSVTANVATGLLYNRTKRGRRRRAVQRALALVGLEERAEDTADKLSGGERQRVAIARAVVNRPALLLADEPTGNLDSTTTVSILDGLDALHAAGITVVVVTHDPLVSSRAQMRFSLLDGALVDSGGPS